MPDYDEELHGDKYDYNLQAIESPSDSVVEHVARRSRIQNPDDVIGMCSECKSEMPHSYMTNNVFAKEGVPVPCKYCNTPEAPVWMGDYTFKPMGDVKEGDEVIGIQLGHQCDTSSRTSKNQVFGIKSRLTKTIVQAVNWHKAPVLHVIMESGKELFCTDNHRWYDFDRRMGDTRKGGLGAFTTPILGKRLTSVVEPMSASVSDDQQYWAGYLGGAYDADGGGVRIGQSNIMNPEVCSRIEMAFNKLDIPFTMSEGHNGLGMRDYTITGGWSSYLAFLQKCNPAKRDLEKYFETSKFRQPDTIISVQPAFGGREVDVVDLTTTTGNYIAWGYASKNCGGVCVITYRELAESIKNTLDGNRRIGLG